MMNVEALSTALAEPYFASAMADAHVAMSRFSIAISGIIPETLSLLTADELGAYHARVAAGTPTLKAIAMVIRDFRY